MGACECGVIGSFAELISRLTNLPLIRQSVIMSVEGMEAALAARMKKLGIREDDLTESFIRGTGAGGQKINKTSSTVVLRHEPTGIEVRCQRERSQSLNRHLARVELCDRIEEQRRAARLEKQQAVEKKRRQNRPRPRGLQEKILSTKHRRSKIKQRRGRVRGDD